MTPKQVARLAVEWFKKNGNEPIETVEHYARVSAFTPSMTATAVGFLVEWGVIEDPDARSEWFPPAGT